MLLGAVGQRRLGFIGEAADGLLLAVLVHLEVFLRKIGDVVALLVGDHRVHQYLLGLGSNHHARVGDCSALLRRRRQGRQKYESG